MALFVTDTHALIWYAQGRSKKLGRRARAAFQQADEGRGVVYVPTVTLVELLEAERAGVIRFARPARAWVQSLFSAGGFIPAELTARVALAAHEMYDIPERTDRLIAATALVLGCPLITRDSAIARHTGVDVVW